MKSLNEWLEEYGESHQNKTNILIHKLCVPLIFISIYFIFFSLPFPLEKTMYAHWANIVYIFALVFYFRLNVKVGFGFLIFGFLLALLSLFAWVFWFYLNVVGWAFPPPPPPPGCCVLPIDMPAPVIAHTVERCDCAPLVCSL